MFCSIPSFNTPCTTSVSIDIRTQANNPTKPNSPNSSLRCAVKAQKQFLIKKGWWAWGCRKNLRPGRDGMNDRGGVQNQLPNVSLHCTVKVQKQCLIKEERVWGCRKNLRPGRDRMNCHGVVRNQPVPKLISLLHGQSTKAVLDTKKSGCGAAVKVYTLEGTE